MFTAVPPPGPGAPLRVALLDDYQHLDARFGQWAQLPRPVELTVFDEPIPSSQLIATLARFDVLVLIRERTALPAAVIDALPNLRLIITTGPRNAAIDGAAAARHGVPICATRESMTSTVEFVWALILAVARRAERGDAALRRGGWHEELELGRTLAGQTLGLVGLGVIGVRVARIAQAFDLPVIAWSQNLTATYAAECGVRRVEKAELFGSADIVSLHTRLSERTRGLVGPAELAAMKPDACLVNTSRGGLIDELALVEALVARRIGGAALDVFENEPLPADHRLRRLPNVLLSPHAAALTREHVAAWFTDITEDLAAWMDDRPVRVINAK